MYIFRLNNLTNDKQIMQTSQLTHPDIKLALDLHQITIADIGIEIIDTDAETSEEDED